MRKTERDDFDKMYLAITDLQNELKNAQQVIRMFPGAITLNHNHAPMPRPHIVTPVFEILNPEGLSSVFRLPGSHIGQYNVEYSVVHTYLPLIPEYQLRMSLEFHWEDNR